MERALKKIEQFHGHIGPYAVLGYRMGIIANKLIGDDPFEKRAVVYTGRVPPLSCIIDGVQLSSGCTLGKGNIEVLDKEEAVTEFIDKNGRLLKISVKKEIIEEIKKSFKEKKDISSNLFERTDKELFEVKFNGENNRTR